MNAKELMIDDWVFYYAGYDKEESINSPVRAIGDQYTDYLTIFLKFCGIDTFGENEIFPIPITPEILERNGFKKEEWTTSSWKRILGGYDHWCDMSRSEGKWYLRIKDDGMFSCVKVVRYVHELQQVFRMFGIKQDWMIEQSDEPDWSLIVE